MQKFRARRENIGKTDPEKLEISGSNFLFNIFLFNELDGPGVGFGGPGGGFF